MSTHYIPKEVRQTVAKTARYRCGYCQTQAAVIGMPLEIEHIMPISLGGTDDLDNLWLSCTLCNRYKGNQVTGFDELINAMVSLFNPRQQKWNDHFAWEQQGLMIVGLTSTGRATIFRLQMNNPFVVRSRAIWINWGWHPPKD